MLRFVSRIFPVLSVRVRRRKTALAVLPLDNADTAWLAEKEDRIKLVSIMVWGRGWGGFFACPSSRADSADFLFMTDAAELRERPTPGRSCPSQDSGSRI